MLALSNSGETPELADLVAHARRFALPLVGITGRAESTLARAADVALLLPAAPEACPMGLAPTTSTTMQLALGDALAVALLTRRGFTAADFRIFHPGGRLGARLSRVRDLMHGAARDAARPARHAHGRRAGGDDREALRLPRHRRGRGRLIGMITDGDLRRALQPGGRGAGLLVARSAGEVMTRSPRTIGPDTLAAEALQADERALHHRALRRGRGRPAGRHPAHPRPAARGGRHELPSRPGRRRDERALAHDRHGRRRPSPGAARRWPARPCRRPTGAAHAAAAVAPAPCADPAGALARRRVAVRPPRGCCRCWRLGLLAAIAFWPELERQATARRVTFRRVIEPRPEALRVVNPHYRGVDEQGRPYTITAAVAQQRGAEEILDLTEPRADILLNDGAWVLPANADGAATTSRATGSTSWRRHHLP